MKTSKILLSLSICISVLLLAYCSVVGLFSSPKYLTYRSHVMSSNTNEIYTLYSTYSGIGDPSWYVLQLDSDFDLDTKVSREYMDEETELANKTILFNYSEAGYHSDNPYIEVVDDRYLVFMRGGLYHGLYDLVEKKSLFNNSSPWHSWLDSLDLDEHYQLSSDERENLFDEWKKENIHNPIKIILDDIDD